MAPAKTDVVKLYGMQMATCTRRVLAVLEEKGVPYELVVVDLSKGEQKLPEYLAKQPFGVIPFFEHGDVKIFESRAIIRYIANTWADQGTDLLGKDAKAKAATDSWFEAETNNYSPPISSIVFEKVFKKWRGQTTDEAVVATQLEKLNKVLDVYEGILSTRPYLAGQEISIADLSHLPYTDYMIKAGVTEPFDKHPAVKEWWGRISSRPSWIKITSQK